MPIEVRHGIAAEAANAGNALLAGLAQGLYTNYLQQLQQQIKERELALHESQLQQEAELKKQTIDAQYKAALAEQDTKLKAVQAELAARLQAAQLEQLYRDKQIKANLAKAYLDSADKRYEKQTELVSKWAELQQKDKEKRIDALTQLRRTEMISQNRLDVLSKKHEYALQESEFKSKLDAETEAQKFIRELAAEEAKMNFAQRKKLAELQQNVDIVKNAPLTEREKRDALRMIISEAMGLKQSIPPDIPIQEQLKNVYIDPQGQFMLFKKDDYDVRFFRPEGIGGGGGTGGGRAGAGDIYDELAKSTMSFISKMFEENPNIKQLDLEKFIPMFNRLKQASINANPQYLTSIFDDLVSEYNIFYNTLSTFRSDMALYGDDDELYKNPDFVSKARILVDQYNFLYNALAQKQYQLVQMRQKTQNHLEKNSITTSINNTQAAINQLLTYQQDITSLQLLVSQNEQYQKQVAEQTHAAQLADIAQQQATMPERLEQAQQQRKNTKQKVLQWAIQNGYDINTTPYKDLLELYKKAQEKEADLRRYMAYNPAGFIWMQ